MSISKALGAEKPAPKRPRSFAQHPLSKIQKTDVKFFGGVRKSRIRARTMSISRALGAEKPATKRPKSYMEGPRGGKASCKKSKKMYVEGCSRGGALCVCGILSIYLSIYIYLYIPLSYIYIYTSLSLSLSLFLSRSSFWRGLRRAHVCASKLQ